MYDDDVVRIVLVKSEYRETDHWSASYDEPELKTFNNIDEFLADISVRNILAKKGFVNVKDQEEMKKNAEATGFFTLQSVYNTDGLIQDKSEIVSNHNVNWFAEGRMRILQEVKLESVLDEKQIEMIEKEKKRIKREKTKRKKAAKESEKKRKEKAIAKAKKLLEEAGELKK